jgi:hypothetical protein
MEALNRVIADLQALTQSAEEAVGSELFVAVRASTAETVIAANSEGCMHLALQLLRILQRGFPGAHYHLDEASVAHPAETSVVFVYEQAPR